jgi:hypothetical protein
MWISALTKVFRLLLYVKMSVIDRVLILQQRKIVDFVLNPVSPSICIVGCCQRLYPGAMSHVQTWHYKYGASIFHEDSSFVGHLHSPPFQKPTNNANANAIVLIFFSVSFSSAPLGDDNGFPIIPDSLLPGDLGVVLQQIPSRC